MLLTTTFEPVWSVSGVEEMLEMANSSHIRTPQTFRPPGRVGVYRLRVKSRPVIQEKVFSPVSYLFKKTNVELFNNHIIL